MAVSSANGATLWIKVKADASDAQKSMQGLFAAMKITSQTTSRDQINTLKLTLRAQEETDKSRVRSLNFVAQEDLKLTRLKIKNLTDYEKTLTEQTRREIMLRREATRETEKEANKQSSFMKAVMSSRFALPGTNGNVMPLIGQTLRGGAGAVAGMAAIGAAGFAADELVKSKKAASDLNETISKSSVIFKQNQSAMEAWANNAATSMAMTKRDALEAASTFAVLLQNMGKVSGKDGAEYSKRLVQMATDLSSLHNVPVAQALEDIRSALTGQIEPMRKYGVTIDEVTLKHKAMEMGVRVSAGALDPATKTMAIYKTLLDQTKYAAGDFARTSDQVANQERILQAQIENLRGELGKNFLPLYKNLLNLTNDIAKSANVAAIGFGALFGKMSELNNGKVKSGGFLEFLATTLRGAGQVTGFNAVMGAAQRAGNGKSAEGRLTQSNRDSVTLTRAYNTIIGGGIPTDMAEVQSAIEAQGLKMPQGMTDVRSDLLPVIVQARGVALKSMKARSLPIQGPESLPVTGGVKPSTGASAKNLEAKLIPLQRQYAEAMETYQKTGSTKARARLESLSQQIYRTEMDVAAAQKAANPMSDPEAATVANARALDGLKQRQDALKKVDEAAGRLSAEDKANAQRVLSSKTLESNKRAFQTLLGNLSEASTPEEISNISSALGGLQRTIQAGEAGAIQSEYQAQVTANPRYTQTAKAQRIGAKSVAAAEDASRSEQIQKAIDTANERIKNAKVKEADQTEKRAVETQKDYVDMLKAEREELQAQESIAHSESERLAILLKRLDNEARQSEAQYSLDMLKAGTNPIEAKAATSAFNARKTGIFAQRVNGINGINSAMIDDAIQSGIIDLNPFRNGERGEYRNAPSKYADQVGGFDRVAYRQGVLQNAGESASQAFSTAGDRAVVGLTMPGQRPGNVAKQFVQEMLGSARGIGAKLVTDSLKPAFTDLGKSLLQNVSGLKGSAKSLALAGSSLYSVYQAISNPKKRAGTFLGAALGFAAGSILPGLGNLEGAQIGASIGGMFAAGGSPPVGRVSLVGEPGADGRARPELFVPREPGNVLNQRQVEAVIGSAGGGSGIVNNFYGPVNDRLDVEIVTRQQESRRRLQALVG